MSRECRRQLFGLTLESSFPFRHRLPLVDAVPDLLFERCAPGEMPARDGCALLYESRARTERGEACFSVLRSEGCHVLRVAEVARFALAEKLCSYEAEGGSEVEVETAFLGTVLSYLFESRGLPAIHAAAVAVGDRTVAFLSENLGGKSALAATLLAEGHRLLTDDVLVLDAGPDVPVARASYPAMRMWPDEADHFLGAHEELPRVHPDSEKRIVPVGEGGFGRFCPGSLPLAAVYVPTRACAPGVTIERLAPADAFIALVRHSFLASPVEGLGWQSRRLPALARIVRGVPFHRLTYPSGFEHLPRVRDAVLADLGQER